MTKFERLDFINLKNTIILVEELKDGENSKLCILFYPEENKFT